MLSRSVLGNRSSHLAALVLVSGLALVVWLVFNGLLYLAGLRETYVGTPAWQWQAGWVAMSFYVAWWALFFVRDVVPDSTSNLDEERRNRESRWETIVEDRLVVPLPMFLEFNTFRRDPLDESSERAVEHFREKASNTIQTISAIVGFSLLIFSLTLTLRLANKQVLSPFQIGLATWILFFQIVAIVAFIIGMDQMDTSMNRFVGFGDETRYRLTRYYYRKGIYYYYRGLVVLIFSAFLSMMLVDPRIVVAGVFVFAVLGYNYWFGYSEGVPPGLDHVVDAQTGTEPTGAEVDELRADG